MLTVLTTSLHSGSFALKKIRGTSRLELLVAATLISIFAAILLDRLAFYQEAAEKAKMEYTISILKSALRMQMATMLTEGRAGDYAALARRNPMDWLEEQSAGSDYVSVAAGSTITKKMAGQWQYDAENRTLTYWPARDEHLQMDASGYKRIRLQVKAVFNTPESESNTGTEPSKKAIASVRLHVEPYQWF